MNDCIRFATSRPILPRPIIANVFPFNSSPINVDRCQAPDFNEVQAFGILLQTSQQILVRQERSLVSYLANEQIKAQVCSAAERVFPPGVLNKGMI